MFDNVLLLRNGHIFAKGKTKALLNSEVITRFLGYEVDMQTVNGEYNLHVQVDTSLIDLLTRRNDNDRS